MMGLYFIKDLVSSVPFTNVTTLQNDKVALQWFCNFLKSDKADSNHYLLVRIGMIDENFSVVDSKRVSIVAGDKAEEMLAEVIANIQEE